MRSFYFVIGTLLLISTMSTSFSQADEFEELSRQQEKMKAKDPFANRKARCSSRTADNLEMVETWDFLGPEKFVRKLVGITIVGSYTLKGSVMKLAAKNGKNWTFKTKQIPDGFQYIHEHEGTKMLYKCKWI